MLKSLDLDLGLISSLVIPAYLCMQQQIYKLKADAFPEYESSSANKGGEHHERIG
ncbi:hypothetical protein RGQ13_19710 [Thalassotalea psychrophila]|uniref:Uncharacterized protein n=1 Tax=Thalassotalea psychrophila TaxID=3065647 RepID=A0ABY9TX25_9GAMM|nr:hypothetical protein RGQ13_19710 [Colwelliaceae bacterium SQ149]